MLSCIYLKIGAIGIVRPICIPLGTTFHSNVVLLLGTLFVSILATLYAYTLDFDIKRLVANSTLLHMLQGFTCLYTVNQVLTH